jgi:hypothetical protein
MPTPITVAPIAPTTLAASFPVPPVYTGVIAEPVMEPVAMLEGHDIEEVGHMEPEEPMGMDMEEVGITIEVVGIGIPAFDST